MIDLYHDPGHGRLRHLLAAHPGAADLLKTAEFEDDAAQVPKTAFAWDARERFPVHTPEHAVVSYLYAKSAAAFGDKPVPREVVAKIAEALDFYGVDAANLAPVETKEAALAPGECLFPDQGTYPVRTRAEVKTAEARLFEELPRMGPETRALAFSQLAKRAEDLGVALRPDAYKYAGMTLTDAKALMRSLEARVAATKVASAKTGFAKLAQAVARDRRGLRDRATQVKLAEAIGDLDARGGLVGFYDTKLPDPIATVFNTTKVAAGPTLDLGGVAVPATDAARLPASFYADALGPDVVREIAPTGAVEPDRLCAVVETLPADLKASLGRAMAGAGVGRAG